MSWTVTLKDLREARACFEGYNRLVRHLQGEEFTDRDAVRSSYLAESHDKPIPILTVLGSNGLDDALWALRCVQGHDREIRLFAVWCARQVQHLMTDPRSLATLDIAERFANGLATAEELSAAEAAAGAAAEAAAGAAAWAAAWAAARYAAWAARDAAQDAAWDAAQDAAWDAAWYAAQDAARAAARDAAWYAAWYAAQDAAWAAAQAAARATVRAAAWAAAGDAQRTKLIEIIEKGI